MAEKPLPLSIHSSPISLQTHRGRWSCHLRIYEHYQQPTGSTAVETNCSYFSTLMRLKDAAWRKIHLLLFHANTFCTLDVFFPIVVTGAESVSLMFYSPWCSCPLCRRPKAPVCTAFCHSSASSRTSPARCYCTAPAKTQKNSDYWLNEYTHTHTLLNHTFPFHLPLLGSIDLSSKGLTWRSVSAAQDRYGVN